MYTQNMSTQEFLYFTFVKINEKIMILYNLLQKKEIDYKFIYEESSKIFEVLNILKSQIDLTKETAQELINVYNKLEDLIFKGINQDSKYLLSAYNIFSAIKS